MRRKAGCTGVLCTSALMLGSLQVAPTAFGQGAQAYTQCHTYVRGGTVYTSKAVPHVGDARTSLAPCQAYITQKYGQASGGRCLSAESIEAAKSRLPQGPKIIATDLQRPELTACSRWHGSS